jgi:DnaJ-class molecular chaperone
MPSRLRRLRKSSFPGVRSLESFEVYHPSFNELFERFWSNFEMFDRPKAERLESLTVEIPVNPDEARLGGGVSVMIPARATCSVCGAHGAVGSYECWRCEGHGSLTTEYRVEVAYPAGVRDGYAARIPLTGLGIKNFYLTVLLRVSGGRL